MQLDGSLFDEILALYRDAGRDPESYRRLERELSRTQTELRGYLRDVARDYVLRLERRLQRSQAHLTPEDMELIRAWEGLRREDPRRERRLLDDLAALAGTLDEVAARKGKRLGPGQLSELRRLLEDGARVLPGIARALEEHEAARKLEAELGDGVTTLKREALLERLRRGLAQES